MRAGLLLLFLAGIALILMGYGGERKLAASGFSEGSGFHAVHALSGDVSAMWKQEILPALENRTDAERAALSELAERLTADAWDQMQSGAGEQVSAVCEEAGGNEQAREAFRFRLLHATYLTNGPRISAADRKKLISLPRERAQAMRDELLTCLLSEKAPVPPEAQSLLDKTDPQEREAVLMQIFLTGCGADRTALGDHIADFKKGIRDKGQQIYALRLIAGGGVGFADQLIFSHSRTIILLGILLIADVILLWLWMAQERRWSFDLKWILILLIINFLMVFQMLPLLYLVFKSLFPDGAFTMETLRRLWSYPLNRNALFNTTVAALATMLLGTLIAFPLAFLVGRTDLYGRRMFRSLFVLTYMVPPYVGAMAWMRLTNPNVGIVNLWLRRILGLGNQPGPLNVYTLPGLIWVLTTFYYPYAFITISRAMEKMDPSLEEASRISGASPVKTLFRVTLPLMLPSLTAGALLVYVSAASCYGIPSIVGTPGNVNTVTTRIVEYAARGQQGMQDAIALSVFLMALALLLLFLSDVVLARRQYITVSGKSTTPTLVHLGAFRLPLTILVGLFAAVVIFLPFATILTTSFKTDVGKSLLDAGNFTLANWKGILSGTQTLSSLKNSLLFATAAATAGIVIAAVMSYLLQRTQVRGRSIPGFLIALGSGTPSVVLALGLILTMRGNFGVSIYGTASILIIAYLIKHLVMGMRTVVSAVSQIHVSLEECSQICGQGWLGTMLKITLPLIFPSVAAGWFLIFIPRYYELSMTTLLYSGTTKTIGFQLYEYWSFTSQPMSCALAFAVLLIVTLLNFVMGRLTKGRFSI